ncbi:MAG TPA: NADH-quinone oxidoreductase subunit C [Prolixibacteraceae bacterium]|nr:NADH-quinone oxidoreductase subunit C [Prolixibacteraceae bacterium]
MLNKQELTELIREFEPDTEIPEGTQLLEAIVPVEKLLSLVEKLKSNQKTAFNYLISETAVDFITHMTVVYHLESTEFRHMVVLKSVLSDRENPIIESLTALYPTAEYFEREIFDLFGIRFNNHPNLKRLFLEDDYGYPLRKDFRDEINIIER